MISFLSVFPPYRGGIARFSDYTFTHLAKQTGVKAHSFEALYPNLLFPGKTQFDGNSNSNYASKILHSFNPFTWKKCAEHILANDPDVLLISFWHPFFIPAFNKIINYVKTHSPKTRIVALAHNILPHESFPFSIKLITSFFYKCDSIITLSDQTTTEFNSLNIGSKCIKLFHPIYETDKIDIPQDELRLKYGFSKSDRIVLFFGLVREYKGLDIMIQALNHLNLEELRIKPFIVGEFYDEKEKYQKLMLPSHKERYTIIDKFVDDNESAEVLSISDLLVLPYKTASQSGVLADALNFNLPTLVANHSGLIEHIENNQNGMIFESENENDLSAKIVEYFTNDALMAKIHSEIPKLKGRLSWQKFISELINILKI